jgi:ATPase subunit of ABC transporter with duplicated ATPase domains
LQDLPQAILLVSHSAEFRSQITQEKVEIRAGQIFAA